VPEGGEGEVSDNKNRGPNAREPGPKRRTNCPGGNSARGKRASAFATEGNGPVKGDPQKYFPVMRTDSQTNPELFPAKKVVNQEWRGREMPCRQPGKTTPGSNAEKRKNKKRIEVSGKESRIKKKGALWWEGPGGKDGPSSRGGPGNRAGAPSNTKRDLLKLKGERNTAGSLTGER